MAALILLLMNKIIKNSVTLIANNIFYYPLTRFDLLEVAKLGKHSFVLAFCLRGSDCSDRTRFYKIK